jgi:hypothetical protein
MREGPDAAVLDAVALTSLPLSHRVGATCFEATRSGILEAMRRQYFFKPADQGYDAWDVHRLVELSADLPVQQVRLGDLRELDTVYWFGADGEPATVRILVRHMELVQRADLRYPVILGSEGQLMDGMHRVARALLEGRTTVTAVRFPDQPEPDFRSIRPQDLDYDCP